MSLRPAAFFDLDLTLIDGNSAMLWAKHERKRGFISRSELLRASFWTLLYKFSLVDIERAYRAATAAYKGLPRQELDDRTRAWFLEEIVPIIRPEANAAIDWHREQKHPLVLLTSATSFEAQIAMEHWEMDGWLANDFDHDAQGKLSGTFHTPLVYGPGKVTHALRYAEEHGIDLAQSYFYSDSYSDLPMLQAVGHPRVVTPDPRLRWEAKKQGWPVLDWLGPTP